jgi:two-component system response regulator AtoC
MSKTPPLRILVVDDEKTLRVSLSLALREEGYDVEEASTGEEAIARLDARPPHLVLLDLRLPDRDGIGILREIRSRGGQTVVIMMTAFDSGEAGFEAHRLGAFSFITKPFELGVIKDLIRSALVGSQLPREPIEIQLGHRDSDRFLLGVTQKMHDVYQIITKVRDAKTSTVLIQGECGTGKELVAKAVHHQSVGVTLPFMVINCGALPANLLESELFGHEAGAFTDARKRKPGLMELAHRGTLFLDEIGEMPLSLQASLLRAIETKTFRRVGGVQDLQVDVRIIAASNRDLKHEVAMSRFRKDLFFRLNVVPIVLPPLRERREDIELLADHFLRHFSRELNRSAHGFSSEARRTLVDYAWPGNIRELRNVIERAVLLHDNEKTTLIEQLPLEGPLGFQDATLSAFGGAESFIAGPLAEAEKRHILGTLQWTKGNKTRAAKILGISRQTLREKLKSYGLGEAEEAAANAPSPRDGQIPAGR